MTAPAVVAVLCVVAALLLLLAVAAKPEVEHRLRRWRRGGDLTGELARRVRETT